MSTPSDYEPGQSPNAIAAKAAVAELEEAFASYDQMCVTRGIREGVPPMVTESDPLYVGFMRIKHAQEQVEVAMAAWHNENMAR